MKRWSLKRWLIVGGAVLLLAIIVLANLKRGGPPSVEARLSKVERTDLTATITAPGAVRAEASVDLSAEVHGRVVELRVAEGDSVREGEILLRLDDVQYKSRVAQARASLASARASLELSEARRDKTRRDKERTEGLFEKDLASQEMIDNVQADLRVIEAEVRAKKEEVDRSQALLDEAEDALEKTIHRAPVNGIVSRLNIEIGENVVIGTMNNPGTVILTIADPSAMEVEAEVDETDVVALAIGQKATITVDAIEDTTFAGAVASVGHSGRSSGQGLDAVITFEVKVRFVGSDPRLRPGMTADVEVETKTRPGVLAVPIQALVARSRGALDRERQRGARLRRETAARSEKDTSGTEEDSEEKDREIVEGVYKLADGEARFVLVTAGIADETRIEVAGDLQEGDEIVSGPFQVLRELREGDRVKAEAKEPAKSDEK